MLVTRARRGFWGRPRPATANRRPVPVILQRSTRWRCSPGDDSLPHSKALLTPGFHLQPSRLLSQAELSF